MPDYLPDNEFRALLDAAVDGIVLIDHRGHIQVFNRSAERLFGYRAEELLGRNVSVLMSEPDRGEHDRHLARYISTRYPHVIGRGREVMALRKDGSLFPAFLSVGAVPGAEPPHFVGFVQDLTSRHRSAEEARRLQESLWHVSRLATVDETVAEITRELHEPLAAIAEHARACDRLLARPETDLGVRTALKEIGSQAQRAVDIIRRLRGLAHQYDGQRESTDVNALIRELTVLVESHARAHGVRCQFELGEPLPSVDLDRAQIQQVILTLVRNAIEACADTLHGQRTVVVRSSRTERGEVEISVCDTGPGVSASLIPYLFEPFRSPTSARPGLGLAISHTIVTRHRGTLEHRANVPAGACFVVRLPATAGQGA